MIQASFLRCPLAVLNRCWPTDSNPLKKSFFTHIPPLKSECWLGHLNSQVWHVTKTQGTGGPRSVGIPTGKAQHAPAPEKVPPLLPPFNLIFRKDSFEILSKPHSRIPLSVSACFRQEVWLIAKLWWEEPRGLRPGSDDTTLLQRQPCPRRVFRLHFTLNLAPQAPRRGEGTSFRLPTIKLLTVPCLLLALRLSPLLLPPASWPTCYH